MNCFGTQSATDHVRRKAPERHSGFTLIELLVVIAIISLLVSILLPSLNRAKDLAKRVVCSTQLKGIGSVIMFYGNDYDGYLPAMINWEARNGWDWTWMYSLVQMYPTDAQSYIDHHSRWSSPWIFECPSSIRGEADMEWADLRGTDYSYPVLSNLAVFAYGADRNLYLDKNGINVPKHNQLGDITAPSDTFGWWDANSAMFNSEVLSSLVGDTTANVSYRHQDGLNSLFMDSHVDCLSPDDIDQHLDSLE